jgi:hypothetical protein
MKEKVLSLQNERIAYLKEQQNRESYQYNYVDKEK